MRRHGPTGISRFKAVLYLLLGGVLVAVPFAGDIRLVSPLTLGMIFAVIAISLNLQLGYGGLPSLGHTVYSGVGAYCVALAQQHTSLGFAATVAFAAIGAGLLAFVVGPVVLRTRGVMFLMITLAVSQVFWGIAMSWRSLTNGDDGLVGVSRPDFAESTTAFYFLVAAVLLGALFVQRCMVRAPLGWTLRATRDNEARARMLGIDVFRVQFSVYVLTGVMAGLGGALYAYHLGFVGPTALDVATSGKVLLMVVVGGAGTALGPVFGALVVEGVAHLGSLFTERWVILLGLIYVLSALFLPERRAPVVRARARQLGRPRSGPGTASAAGGSAQPPSQATLLPVAAARAESPGGRTTGDPILRVSGLSKAFDGNQVLRDVSLCVERGERRGLIGPNGAGKTTLFNMISGSLRPSAGAIWFDGAAIERTPPHKRARRGLGRTYQIASLFGSMTVLEHVVLGIVSRRPHLVMRSLRSPLHDEAVREEALSLLESTGLADMADSRLSELAYGYQRIVEILLALVTRPKLLLLDEPAAGLAGAEVVRLVELLSSVDPGLTLVIIEHDMDVLFDLVERVTVLDGGELLAEGTPDDIRTNAEVRARYLGRSAS